MTRVPRAAPPAPSAPQSALVGGRIRVGAACDPGRPLGLQPMLLNGPVEHLGPRPRRVVASKYPWIDI
jgi:hypothetical protein